MHEKRSSRGVSVGRAVHGRKPEQKEFSIPLDAFNSPAWRSPLDGSGIVHEIRLAQPDRENPASR